jgi:hypothetical protein
VSKAFSICKNTAAVDILLLKLIVTWSVNFTHCSVVLWCARNPNSLASSKFIRSEVTLRLTVGQSVSKSRCWTHLGTCDQILILSEFCCAVFVLSVTVSNNCPSPSFLFFSFVFSPILQLTHFMYIQYMQGLVSPGSVQQIMAHHL